MYYFCIEWKFHIIVFLIDAIFTFYMFFGRQIKFTDCSFFFLKLMKIVWIQTQILFDCDYMFSSHFRFYMFFLLAGHSFFLHDTIISCHSLYFLRIQEIENQKRSPNLKWMQQQHGDYGMTDLLNYITY